MEGSNQEGNPGRGNWEPPDAGPSGGGDETGLLQQQMALPVCRAPNTRARRGRGRDEEEKKIPTFSVLVGGASLSI